MKGMRELAVGDVIRLAQCMHEVLGSSSGVEQTERSSREVNPSSGSSRPSSMGITRSSRPA